MSQIVYMLDKRRGIDVTDPSQLSADEARAIVENFGKRLALALVGWGAPPTPADMDAFRAVRQAILE